MTDCPFKKDPGVVAVAFFVVELGDEIFPAGDFFAVLGRGQGSLQVDRGAVIDILFIVPEGPYFLQVGHQSGWELRVVQEDLDEGGSFGEFILGDVVADLPDEPVVAAGGDGESFLEDVRVFFGGYDTGVIALDLVFVTADGQVIGVLIAGRKGPVEKLEAGIGRVEVFFIIVGLADEEVEVVDPVVSGIMDQDAHGAFVDHGVEVSFLGGGIVEAIVIKGKQFGIIFPVAQFGAGDDHLELFIGVEPIIIVGDGVLDEVAASFEFLAVVGGFRGEDAVFESFGFGQVIVHSYLGRNGQVKKRKDTQ